MNRIAAVVAGLSLAFVGTSATFAGGGGTTWTVCPSGCDFLSIQDAIDASSDDDVINIAAGTYNEYILNTAGKAITIQGTLNSDGSLVTTIDAQQGGSVFVINSGEGSGTMIKDLVITGGTPTTASKYGGGIYCTNSSPTITGCTISDNTADGAAGSPAGGTAAPPSSTVRSRTTRPASSAAGSTVRTRAIPPSPAARSRATRPRRATAAGSSAMTAPPSSPIPQYAEIHQTRSMAITPMVAETWSRRFVAGLMSARADATTRPSRMRSMHHPMMT